jgi:hypothetical protein
VLISSSPPSSHTGTTSRLKSNLVTPPASRGALVALAGPRTFPSRAFARSALAAASSASLSPSALSRALRRRARLATHIARNTSFAAVIARRRRAPAVADSRAVARRNADAVVATRIISSSLASRRASSVARGSDATSSAFASLARASRGASAARATDAGMRARVARDAVDVLEKARFGTFVESG